MNMKRRMIMTAGAAVGLAGAGYWGGTRLNLNPARRPGEQIDTFNNVAVYYNGGVNHSAGRNLSADGYNLGIRYQCVEFVKRYYFERFSHRMPDSYGHARDFFDPVVPDGALNPRRGLMQYRRDGAGAPQVEDLLVLGPSLFNPYGHVAIVTGLRDGGIEVIQQNPGPFGASREVISRDNARLLGWLRLAGQPPT